MSALASPAAFQEYFAQLQSAHPAAWTILAERLGGTQEELQVPVLSQPCWTSFSRAPGEDTCRYAVTISCRQETEREDVHHARNVLAFHFRLVDLQTAEVLLTFAEKLERGWQRKVF